MYGHRPTPFPLRDRSLGRDESGEWSRFRSWIRVLALWTDPEVGCMRDETNDRY
jgi:hypothetical protein